VGSAAEWGECGSYYGEDIEWEGLGSGESCWLPIWDLNFLLENF